MFKDKNANVFRDLATLIEAGMPVLDAARKVAVSHQNVQLWSFVIRELEAGRKLNIALSKSKLISSYEQEIISVSEFSGRLSQGLRAIADSYDIRRKRVSKFKSKLYFPFAVLAIAIVVSAIKTLTSGSQEPFFSVISNAMLWLVLSLFLTRMLSNLIQKSTSFWLQLMKNSSQNEWYQMQFQQVVFGALLWQMNSGIDFKAGFLRISKLLAVTSLTKKLKQASAYCGQGLSISQSCIRSKLPITNEFKEVLLTGEQSGQWEHSIEKYLKQQSILLDIKVDSILEWIPRVYYGLIALIAILVIF